MRIHGYCTSCHKIKMVRVSGSNLALAVRGGAQGICSECEEAKEKRE